MINKKLLLGSLFLLLFASDSQAISGNYPSKKTLNRINHIISLITTASLIGCPEKKIDSPELKKICSVVFIGSLAMNVLVNVMALKYDKKIATLLKLCLPVAFPIALILKKSEKQAVKNVAEGMAFFSIIGNCVKNIWDIYFLTGDMYSSIQDMRAGAHEDA